MKNEKQICPHCNYQFETFMKLQTCPICSKFLKTKNPVKKTFFTEAKKIYLDELKSNGIYQLIIATILYFKKINHNHKNERKTKNVRQ